MNKEVKAINISLQEYNTAISENELSWENGSLKLQDNANPVFRAILRDGPYTLIVIDDVEQGQRQDNLNRKWMDENKPVVTCYAKFHDSEGEEPGTLDLMKAEMLANVIQAAMENGHNLIVSCIAGISRSGAVVQAAIDYGFGDTGKYRKPNNRVKNMIKDSLGININQNTSVFNQSSPKVK